MQASSYFGCVFLYAGGFNQCIKAYYNTQTNDNQEGQRKGPVVTLHWPGTIADVLLCPPPLIAIEMGL